MEKQYKGNRVASVRNDMEREKIKNIEGRKGDNSGLTDRQLLEEIHAMLVMVVEGVSE